MAGSGDYTFVLARLGPLHLGCNREVAALLRWLLTQVSLYHLMLKDVKQKQSMQKLLEMSARGQRS